MAISPVHSSLLLYCPPPPCSAQYAQWIESELRCLVQTYVDHLKEIAASITDTGVYASWTVLFLDAV